MVEYEEIQPIVDRIENFLLRLGLDVSVERSSKSASSYIYVTAPNVITHDGREIHGRTISIRVSDHHPASMRSMCHLDYSRDRHREIMREVLRMARDAKKEAVILPSDAVFVQRFGDSYIRLFFTTDCAEISRLSLSPMEAEVEEEIRFADLLPHELVEILRFSRSGKSLDEELSWIAALQRAIEIHHEEGHDAALNYLKCNDDFDFESMRTIHECLRYFYPTTIVGKRIFNEAYSLSVAEKAHAV